MADLAELGHAVRKDETVHSPRRCRDPTGHAMFRLFLAAQRANDETSARKRRREIEERRIKTSENNEYSG